MSELCRSDVVRYGDDWRRQLEPEIADEHRPGRWKRVSDTFLKMGFALLVAVSLLAVIVPQFTNGPGSIVGIAGALSPFCGLVILGVRSVKYDLLPTFRKLREGPKETLRTGWNRF